MIWFYMTIKTSRLMRNRVKHIRLICIKKKIIFYYISYEIVLVNHHFLVVNAETTGVLVVGAVNEELPKKPLKLVVFLS